MSQDLSQRFAHYFGLKQVPGAADLVPGKNALAALAQQAKTANNAGPKPQLSNPARQALGAKRFTVLREALIRCGEGAAKTPALTQATGISQQTCQNAHDVDVAADSLVQATGRAFTNASDTSRLLAGEAADKTQTVLAEVKRRLDADDTRIPASSLRPRFSPIFNAYTNSQAQKKRVLDARDKANAPSKAALAQAQTQHKQTQMIDQFTQSQKPAT